MRAPLVRPTRRDFLAASGGLLLLLAAPGCWGTDGETSGGSRTVRHAMGESDVPTAPERIVALTGQMDLDALLALGLQPIAAGANFENDREVNPWSAGDLQGGAEVFKYRPEPNVEQIAAFEPDLILGHEGWLEPVYDKLSEVAPTVVTGYDGGPEGEDAMWRGPMRVVARAVGREGKAEEILSRIDARMEEASGRLEGLEDLEVSVFSALEGYQAYYTPVSYPGYVLERLGLGRPAAQKKIPTDAADPQQIEFSDERLDILRGDVAFCTSFGEDDYLDDWETKPLFRSLGVAQNDRYVRLTESESNYWYYPTVMTPDLMVKSLIAHLESLGLLDQA